MKDKKSIFEINIVVIIGALICCFLWGSAFPFIKIGYKLFDIAPSDSASQILFAGVRFFIAGIMAIIIGSVLQKRVLFPKKNEVKSVIFISFFQTIGQYFFFYIGLAHTSGVRSAIITGTNVFVAIIVASLIFKQEDLTSKKIVGSVVGFLGVIVINVAGKSLGSGSFLHGDLLIFGSTFCYAFSSVLLKRYSAKINTVMISGYQFVFGGLVMAVAGAAFGGKIGMFGTAGMKAMLVLIYLAFISAAAYSLWGVLLKYNPISKVAVIGFMNPVFGVTLSAILLGEGSGLGFECVIALLLVCAGIVIVNKDSDNNSNSNNNKDASRA